MSFRIIALTGCVMLMGCTTTSTQLLPSVDIIEYRLAPGDKIKLEVFREELLSGDYIINENGIIELPMVGEMKAAGKTLAELRTELHTTLSQSYVRNAKININIAGYRPIYILGRVDKEDSQIA